MSSSTSISKLEESLAVNREHRNELKKLLEQIESTMADVYAQIKLIDHVNVKKEEDMMDRLEVEKAALEISIKGVDKQLEKIQVTLKKHHQLALKNDRQKNRTTLQRQIDEIDQQVESIEEKWNGFMQQASFLYQNVHDIKTLLDTFIHS
jgi:predicted ribosome quality control (RQC) complex YloA/Tae2 family protein